MENNIHEMQRVLESQKKHFIKEGFPTIELRICLLYTSPSPRDRG